MEEQPWVPENVDEYSASSTIIKFEYPIPLLRGPVPASPSHDASASSSSSPFVLAFKNAQSWATAYKACESKIIEQCEGGARIGCAIAASNKCKPPWWRRQSPNLEERAACEEREMEACVALAKDKCVLFAKDKCLKPFSDARIAVGERKLKKELLRKLVCLVSLPQKSKWVSLKGFDEFEFGITNFKASKLLRPDAM